MPPMAAEPLTPMPNDNDQKLAVTSELLFLANLLLLPGVAFIWLLILNIKRAKVATPLALCHLRQTLAASIWAGVLLIPVTVLTIAMGGYESIGGWTIAIIYFTVCHASLVLLGVFGLSKAMAGQSWRYPIIGPICGSKP